MYVTYKGITYVIVREYGPCYDLDNPDGTSDTLHGVYKKECSEERDLYDEDEWLEEQSEEEEE